MNASLAWLEDPSKVVQLAAEWLGGLDCNLRGPQLAEAKRAARSLGLPYSAGSNPLSQDEIDIAFASGYHHPNFRDVIDTGHARLLAGLSKWCHLLDECQLVAIAATEPTGGARLDNLQTTAVSTGAGWWEITGMKNWVSRALEASAVVVFASDGTKPRGFVVALPDPRVVAEIVNPAGLDGWSWANMRFDAAIVEQDDEIIESFSSHFARYRIVISAVAAGTAACCMDLWRARLQSRPGPPPGRLLEVLGSGVADVQACLALCRSATGRVPSPLDGKLVKGFCIPRLLTAIRALLTFSGAVGYRAEDPIRSRCRALEAFEHADGPTDALLRSAGQILIEELKR